MSSLGPQFEQMSLFPQPAAPGMRDYDAREVHERQQSRAAYHSRDKFLSLPEAARRGGELTRVTKRGPEMDYSDLPARQSFRHVTGQTVMGVHDLNSPVPDLDEHGNASLNVNAGGWQATHLANAYNRAAQAVSRGMAGTMQRISTDAVLHTKQTPDVTGSHAYINGPIRADNPPKIVKVGGMPLIYDGHHRIAEARGRGDTHFDAEVIDADMPEHQLNPQQFLRRAA